MLFLILASSAVVYVGWAGGKRAISDGFSKNIINDSAPPTLIGAVVFAASIGAMFGTISFACSYVNYEMLPEAAKKTAEAPIPSPEVVFFGSLAVIWTSLQGMIESFVLGKVVDSPTPKRVAKKKAPARLRGKPSKKRHSSR